MYEKTIRDHIDALDKNVILQNSENRNLKNIFWKKTISVGLWTLNGGKKSFQLSSKNKLLKNERWKNASYMRVNWIKGDI